MIDKLTPQIMKKATFKVIFPTNYEFANPNSKVETSYEIEYSNPLELKKFYQEARQVWSEYIVEAHTDTFVMSDSQTYQEEIQKQLMAAEW